MIKMPKQSQILAVEKGTKSKIYGEITEKHKLLGKAPLLTGLTKTYQSKEDEGDQYPGEKQLVQVVAADVVRETFERYPEIWDIVLTKDVTNCKAMADVIVDEGLENPVPLLKDVPVTTLLWLQKQLDDLYTFVKGLPTLSPEHEWKLDEGTNCWRSPPIKTSKKKKIAEVITLAPATVEHPAQVQLQAVDVIEGYWTTVHFSGTMQAKKVTAMLERIHKLQKAVRFAKEKANNQEADMRKMGETLLNYVSGN